MRPRPSPRAVLFAALATSSLAVAACSEEPSTPPSGETAEGVPNRAERPAVHRGPTPSEGAVSDTATDGALAMTVSFWVAGGLVHAAALVENTGPVPVEVEFGSDALVVTLQDSEGEEVWSSVARTDPVTGEPVAFEDYLARDVLPPGGRTEGGAVPSAFRFEYPTGAISDALGSGTYDVRAVLDLVGARGEFDLGTVDLPAGSE